MGNILKKIDKERRRTQDRVKKEADRATRRVEKEFDRVEEEVRESLDRTARDLEKGTGINFKPIVKTVAGPVHILVKIAEGHNLQEATTDWAVNHAEGYGELGGILGSDVEELVETITTYADVPLLLLVGLAGDTMEVVEGDVSPEDLVGSPLKALIEHAHAVYDNYAKPLPPGLKMILKEVVDVEILKRARFVVDRSPDNIAGLANKLHHGSGGNRHAVTLDDIIVFSGVPGDSIESYLHWVHELKHVEQYRDWGLLEFAAKYTTDADDVEDDATAAAEAARPVLESKFADL